MGSRRRRRMFKRYARARNKVIGLLWSWAERGSILLGFAWFLLRTRPDVSPPLPPSSRPGKTRPHPAVTPDGGVMHEVTS
jgi:hypothetical protein